MTSDPRNPSTAPDARPPGQDPGPGPAWPDRAPGTALRRWAVRAATWWWTAAAAAQARHGERAQGTVEYALVLLGAAAVALALVAWVGRSDVVGRLFDAVLGRILDRA